ncbi:hypothetical protein [Pelagibacterium mangrovi]|uniref:hypothetical protein n=1 Tax=Pelagibacterium mangrovi TaxID=3119828 RepID=UPI002FC7D364
MSGFADKEQADWLEERGNESRLRAGAQKRAMEPKSDTECIMSYSPIAGQISA